MAGSSDLRDITIADARDALAAGQLSARDLTNAFLEAIEEERYLNAFITETPDRALADADASDARRAKGETLSPLDGIPIGIKDLFCTDGVQTTAASHILEGFIPPYESTVTSNLRAAGTVMLGKTNLEDTLCAGGIIAGLENFEIESDTALIAKALHDKTNNILETMRLSSHAKRLSGYDNQIDIEFCSRVNTQPIVPILEENKIVLS